MAHGIMELDKGFVQGESTWHKLPQYKCIPDRPITIMEALEIANYPIEKRRLFRQTPSGYNGYSAVDAWALVRSDSDVTLVDSVGSKFTLLQNDWMVRFIHESMPEMEIESVGTLFNGATFFLNLKMDPINVKGDKSPIATNLMYANPLGAGSYKACAHTTRIVCNNTLRMAELQGAANKSLTRFRHTASAGQQITTRLIEIGELYLGVKTHEEQMNALAEVDVTAKQVDEFLESLFPTFGKEGRGLTIAQNSIDGIRNIFEGRSHRETLVNPYTKYGLLNAYTDWIDHEATSKNMDDGSLIYDGIAGSRADKKDKFLKQLVAA